MRKFGSHSGKLVHPNWKLQGFKDVVSDLGLHDLGMEGYQFTWEMSKGNKNWLEERLDHGLASINWIRLFPQAKVSSLKASCSDHLHIFFDPNPLVYQSRVKKFRFENLWLCEPDCQPIVQDSWASSGNVSIQSKINACGSDLLRWGSYLSRDFHKRIRDCKQRIGVLRGLRDVVSLGDFTEARNRYNELLHSHEIFWKQRSKSLWLKEGDLNPRYFHAMASTRKRQNMIGKLRNSKGQWCTDPAEINELIGDYFTKIFSSEGGSCDEVIQCVEKKLMAGQNHSLMEPFTTADVRDAIFSMYPDKSPVPNGMNPVFLKKFWSIVGEDVSSTCLDCIRQCEFPVGLNETSIVLIPKKSNPEHIIDLRPISLCYVFYKIIIKMLANRLKLVLGSFISNSQSACIPSRTITDNILISTEIMHYLKRKRQGKEGTVAFKIDMSKAYDRIEWSFLKSIILRMGFAIGFVDLIMLCVSTVTYRITREGMDVGPIIPNRGLRQGDPLSAYLFIICVEGLSSLISHYKKAGLLDGVRVARGGPCITHLFLADIVSFFTKLVSKRLI